MIYFLWLELCLSWLLRERKKNSWLFVLYCLITNIGWLRGLSLMMLSAIIDVYCENRCLFDFGFIWLSSSLLYGLLILKLKLKNRHTERSSYCFLMELESLLTSVWFWSNLRKLAIWIFCWWGEFFKEVKRTCLPMSGNELGLQLFAITFSFC